MKTKILIVSMLFLLLTSFTPLTALAAAPSMVQVSVRNQTAGVVNISLTDINGNVIYKTIEPNTTTFSIEEGIYTYYAHTLCGNQSGKWNLNLNKTLFLTCKNGTLGSSFMRTAGANVNCDLGYYEHLLSNPRPDQFVSWTNQSQYIISRIDRDFGTTITTLKDAIDFYNANYSGEARYKMGCYDGNTTYLDVSY